MENLKEFFNKKFTYAIVGASNNEKKYGYKIFKILKDNNINVIPINPKEKEVQGVKCYPSILDTPNNIIIDVVDFVVPPNVTLKVLEEVLDYGIDKVWFQPGSYNKECEKFCKENGIKYMKEFCLYEESLKRMTKNN